jgi:radical SAM superfamily enzyme YgiQ (UPF0313 family)
MKNRMYDENVVVRPPSEAESLLLHVTNGCSHNTCIFCGTYEYVKFRIRHAVDIKADIDKVAASYSLSVQKVFLEAGDALIAPQRILVEVMKYLYQKFPKLERVGTYASPQSALIKTPEQLQELHELGLTIAYLGVETGDKTLLKKIDKGATYEQVVEAGRKIKQAGITLSVTVILGLGGVANSQAHALGTSRILTDLDPDYAGALTLMLVPGTQLCNEAEAGQFELISPFQSLEELKTIIENSNFTNCFFTANHASNYLPLKVRLPQQKAEVVSMLSEVITAHDMSRLRPEFIRAL